MIFSVKLLQSWSLTGAFWADRIFDLTHWTDLDTHWQTHRHLAHVESIIFLTHWINVKSMLNLYQYYCMLEELHRVYQNLCVTLWSQGNWTLCSSGVNPPVFWMYDYHSNSSSPILYITLYNIGSDVTARLLKAPGTFMITTYVLRLSLALWNISSVPATTWFGFQRGQQIVLSGNSGMLILKTF